MATPLDYSERVSLTQENGAITHVQAYVSELDGAVVIEIDTDANYEETHVRVFVNDGFAWEEKV
jgi:hypothetical protein